MENFTYRISVNLKRITAQWKILIYERHCYIDRELAFLYNINISLIRPPTSNIESL